MTGRAIHTRAAETCLICNQLVRLRKDGRLVRHRRNTGQDRFVRCDGSGLWSKERWEAERGLD